MKLAVLGASGMLGSKLAALARVRGHEVLAPARASVDLERPHTLERFFRDAEFDALANCAAFTRVDACEEPARFSKVWNVNGTAVGWMAKFCRSSDRVLLHFSTDYVFDGRKDLPYDEADPTAPLNVYGRSKRQGEKLLEAEAPRAFTVRTSWLYGPGGDHFVATMAKLLGSRPKLEVVTDQVGAPTYTGDVADFALTLLEKGAEPGIYHFADAGETSWHGFAKEIADRLGLTACEIAPVLSGTIFRPAARPANSRFDLSKAVAVLGRPIRDWKDALGEYLEKEFRHAVS